MCVLQGEVLAVLLGLCERPRVRAPDPSTLCSICWNTHGAATPLAYLQPSLQAPGPELAGHPEAPKRLCWSHRGWRSVLVRGGDGAARAGQTLCGLLFPRAEPSRRCRAARDRGAVVQGWGRMTSSTSGCSCPGIGSLPSELGFSRISPSQQTAPGFYLAWDPSHAPRPAAAGWGEGGAGGHQQGLSSPWKPRF